MSMSDRPTTSVSLRSYRASGDTLRSTLRVACHPKPVGRRVAERAGFEPALRFPVNTLSKRAPSTARPPLLRLGGGEVSQAMRRPQPCHAGQAPQKLAIFVPPSHHIAEKKKQRMQSRAVWRVKNWCRSAAPRSKSRAGGAASRCCCCRARTCWKPSPAFVAGLAKTFEVIVASPPGFGRSSPARMADPARGSGLSAVVAPQKARPRRACRRSAALSAAGSRPRWR